MSGGMAHAIHPSTGSGRTAYDVVSHFPSLNNCPATLIPTMTASQDTIGIDPLVQREKDLNTFFAFVLALWPFSTMAIMMSEDPVAMPHHVLYWTTLMYGPVFAVALAIARQQNRKGSYAAAARTWLFLCGTHVATWIASFVLLLATR
jgi:hypothetical protein